MHFIKEYKETKSIKLSYELDGETIGHAYVYIIYNDLHSKPYGLLEDVQVNPNKTKSGIGTLLIKETIEIAKKENCYKLVGTSRLSRMHIHKWYKKLSFEEYGKEFRINLPQ